MPTTGVPKNSATIAPISASVELIFSALKMKGSGRRQPELEQRLPVARRVGAHQVALHVRRPRPGPATVFTSIGKKVMMIDDRRLRLPVEAEPHHHDRRHADDRQRRDHVADRQQAAAQEQEAVGEDGDREARRRSRSRSRRCTALKIVWWTSAARIGIELAMRTPMAEGGGSRMNGTLEAGAPALPRGTAAPAPKDSATKPSRSRARASGSSARVSSDRLAVAADQRAANHDRRPPAISARPRRAVRRRRPGRSSACQHEGGDRPPPSATAARLRQRTASCEFALARSCRPRSHHASR